VVGVDFLFWFCYGHVREESERLQRFETGLKLLEKLRCPLLLGDIPDASGAADRMLSEEEIPSAEVIATANRRLQEWAATHRQVVIVSLSDFMRRVMANQALSIHGKTLPRGRTRVLLQDDKLHPSPPGCAFLALAMVDALQTAQPALFAGEVRWNPAEVLRLGVGIPQGPPDNSTNRAPASVSAGK